MSAVHQMLFVAGGKPAPVVANAGFASTAAGGSAASLAATMPSGIVAGNLLLALVGAKKITGTLTAFSASAGWTKIGEHIDDTRRSLCVFWKIAAGSDTLTVTPNSTTASISIEVLRITGAHASAAPEAGTSVNTANPPSLTPSFTSAADLFIAFHNNGGTSTLTSYPASYDLYQNNQAVASAVANDNKIYRACRAISGTQDPGIYTIGSTTNPCSQTIAVRQAT